MKLIIIEIFSWKCIKAEDIFCLGVEENCLLMNWIIHWNLKNYKSKCHKRILNWTRKFAKEFHLENLNVSNSWLDNLYEEISSFLWQNFLILFCSWQIFVNYVISLAWEKNIVNFDETTVFIEKIIPSHLER